MNTKFLLLCTCLVLFSGGDEYSINGSLLTKNSKQNKQSKKTAQKKKSISNEINRISNDFSTATNFQDTPLVEISKPDTTEHVSTMKSSVTKESLTTPKYFKLLNSYYNGNSKVRTIAPFAIVIDATTKTILFAKNEHDKITPSSMTKMILLYVLFDYISRDKYSLNQHFIVSRYAHKMEGSKMFLAENEKVSIDDLINGIIIVSGNDASITVAENIAGSESIYADLMTEKAVKLGMSNTNFVNCTGWPMKAHYSTVYDLAILAMNLWYQFPEYRNRYKQKNFKHNNIKQNSYNDLLYSTSFVDGIKTGHTDVGGFGIAISAHTESVLKRRFFVIINGCSSVKTRREEALKLISFATRNFENYRIIEKDKPITQIKLWNSEMPYVEVYSKADIIIPLDIENVSNAKFSIVYNQCTKQVVEGEEIGKLRISCNKNFEDFPIYSMQTSKPASLISRALNGIKFLLLGQH